MTNDLARWRGRTAVVTGASSGIGAGIAHRLASEGLTVVGGARRRDRLDALADEIAAAGGRFVPVACDLRSLGDIDALFAAASAEGGVDVLVNNAGLGHHAPLLDDHVERWREMLDVNVLALCACTQRAVADMRARGVEGHVVHISSMAAHRVPSGSGVYAATKFAVRALTEALRKELWEADVPIRVGAISPAYVETEFAAKYHRRADAADEAYGRYQVLTPDDVAEAVCYLIGQPLEVQVHDVLLRPRRQET